MEFVEGNAGIIVGVILQCMTVSILKSNFPIFRFYACYEKNGIPYSAFCICIAFRSN